MVKIYSTVGQMGAAAAEDVAVRIVELLKKKPELNIVFASAPSQSEFLMYLSGNMEIEWGKINAFHMDEYIGKTSNSRYSFGNFLRTRLFGRLPFKSVNYMDGTAADIERECRRYAALLEKYPPDIICLGIGENGHIAFNDPDVADFNDSEIVKTVTLDKVCRQQQVNEKCFETLEDVPTMAMTMTIPALLKADRMYCIVPFKNKADAVFETIYGDISEKCPASILRKKENSCLYLNSESAQRVNNAFL